MKIEEAIEILEHKFDESCRNNLFQNAEKLDYEDALYTAITALRSMPEAGEPLTVERLREMDGKPVWIEDKEYPENTGWVIWDDSFKQNWLGDPETRNSHGKSWFAYSYPPAHIDRSKWTAEWVPMTDDDGCVWLECSTCEYDLDSLEESHPFCPSCGRAMMPEALAELERRLRLPEPPEEG